jgi:hypothetical protein
MVRRARAVERRHGACHAGRAVVVPELRHRRGLERPPLWAPRLGLWFLARLLAGIATDLVVVYGGG